MLFFTSYLVFGLYFVFNFLLAIIFNRFKERMEQNTQRLYDKTETLLVEFFDRFDKDKTGRLTWQEAQEFFSHLLILNLEEKRDLQAFSLLIRQMGCHDQNVIPKERVVQFFMIEDGYFRF